MPFKSKAQQRLFWAKVGRGEIPYPVAKEWEKETYVSYKDLPEKVSDIEKRAFFDELEKISASIKPT
jgi:hypothetical protein